MDPLLFKYRGSVTVAGRNGLAPFIRPGDLAVDATAGRGHDCAELASAVGSSGRVIGVDVQSSAVHSASARMEKLKYSQVAVLRGCHSSWHGLLPPDWENRVKAFVYNLGYLPGSDHSVTTAVDTTRASIENAFSWLRPDGIIRIVAYRGHPGGEEECRAVWALLPQLGRTAVYESATGNKKSPVLFFLSATNAGRHLGADPE